MQKNQPKILTENGLNMFIDTVKLRELNLPIIEIDINDLLWIFDMPVWSQDETDDWNLTPWEVIKKSEGSTIHQARVEASDILFPLIITRYNSKYTILDGVHRLVKLYLNGSKKVKVKIIPSNYLEMAEFQT